MEEITWHGPPAGHQFVHIECGPFEITREQFEQAFYDRVAADDMHQGDGSIISIGFTDDGVMIEMVWRWDLHGTDRVFPITAYIPDE